MFEGICSEDRLVEVRTVGRREPEAESDVGGHVTSGLQHSTVATMCAEYYVPTMR